MFNIIFCVDYCIIVLGQLCNQDWNLAAAVAAVGRFQGREGEIGQPNQRDRQRVALRERLSLLSQASLRVLHGNAGADSGRPNACPRLAMGPGLPVFLPPLSRPVPGAKGGLCRLFRGSAGHHRLRVNSVPERVAPYTAVPMDGPLLLARLVLAPAGA